MVYSNFNVEYVTELFKQSRDALDDWNYDKAKELAEEIIDIKVERERIMKQFSKLKDQIQKVEKKLEGPFSKREPPELVKLEEENLNELIIKKNTLKEQLEVLK